MVKIKDNTITYGKQLWLDNHYKLNPHMMFKFRKELVKEGYLRNF